MASLLFVAALASFSACTKDNPENGDPISTKADKKIKGIWEVVSFRMSGSNLMDYNPTSYFVIDPASDDFVIMYKASEGEQTGLPGMQAMKMQAGKKDIKLVRIENFGPFVESRDERLVDNVFQYEVSKDGDELFFTVPALSFLSESEMAAEPEATTINISLRRDTSAETAVGEVSTTGPETKGWLTDFFKPYVQVGLWVIEAVDYVTDKFTSNFIDPYTNNVKNKKWNNSGWKPENWMSLLPADMLVCNVNIPGSHDSATAIKNMESLAKTVNANCQDLYISEQFNVGARYFDFRVGTQYVVELLKMIRRVPTQEECDSVEDLNIYHGNFCTDSQYKATLDQLAQMIRAGGDSEFIIVNTQWEELSCGLLAAADLWADGKLVGEDHANEVKREMKYASMNIAARLQRELNEKYENKLFLPYRPDLTVGEARGHIIIMMSNYNKEIALANTQASYIFDWPDKDYRPAHICAYADNERSKRTSDPYNIVRDGQGYNMLVQSHYEMRLSEDAKIGQKKTDMLDLAQKVTQWNIEEGKRILGFNSMNANAGGDAFYDLDVHEFAHQFNGPAFDMYVDNMKNSPEDKRFHSGIVSMDYLGCDSYRPGVIAPSVDVYGDMLLWAVIESNFYKK